MSVLDIFLPFILIFFFCNFILCGLLINFIQLCTYILVRPFSKDLYRKLNVGLSFLLYSHMTFAYQWWSGSEITVNFHTKEDADNVEKGRLFGEEHCLILLNHKYDIDWLVGYCLVERIKLLGNSKVYAKEALKYIPIQGWAWIFNEVFFLKRDLEKDRDIITKGVRNYCSFPPGYPCGILLFAEGTRFTEQKHKASVEVALSKGMSPLKHHLLPRSKGFVMTLQAVSNEQLPAVYDCCVAFSKEYAHPSFINILLRKKTVAGFHCKRVSTNDIPHDDEGCAEWLQQAYRDKDVRFDNFLRDGKFDGYQGKMPRRPHDLLAWCCQASFSAAILVRVIAYVLTNMSAINLSCLLAAALAVSLMIRYMITFSEIEKGSTYGKTTSEANTSNHLSRSKSD